MIELIFWIFIGIPLLITLILFPIGLLGVILEAISKRKK